jgi:NADH-ubiquinone oxidoreductase chain 2
MLLIGLTSLLIAIPLYSSTGSQGWASPTLLTRITSIILLFSAAISFNGLYVQAIGSGLGLYSGLFHVTTVTQGMEIFLYVAGRIILLPWASEAVVSANENGTSSSFAGAFDGRGKVSHSASPSQTDLDPSNLDSDSRLELGNNQHITSIPSIAEYPLIILFTTIGGSFLISSADLVSMYLSIELQSFAVYILAAIYRNSESATSAGLKYFLLGALSSALILLGSSLIYAYTGLTNFEGIYTLTSVAHYPITGREGDIFANNLSKDTGVENAVVLGVLIIRIGFLFKVAAAPFHNWAPDVYDGVPTIVTTWLTVMPKIAIFVFLLELQLPSASLNSITRAIGFDQVIENHQLFSPDLHWKNLLLTTSLLSLVIGTVVGLAQYRLKRLLAYSTISHVGFLLLALSVNSEESVTSFLFYLIQYSVTNLNAFFVVLALGYLTHTSLAHQQKTSLVKTTESNSTQVEVGGDVQSLRQKRDCDITFISQLKGQFYANPILGLSLAFCLFSMAGIPPLVGFFAKYMVLYSAIEKGYYFIALVGILASVISAAYYLRIIRVIHFDQASENGTERFLAGENVPFSPDLKISSSLAPSVSQEMKTNVLSSTHSYVIAVLTLLVVFFIFSPSLVLNSSNLLALSLFTA